MSGLTALRSSATSDKELSGLAQIACYTGQASSSGLSTDLNQVAETIASGSHPFGANHTLGAYFPELGAGGGCRLSGVGL